MRRRAFRAIVLWLAVAPAMAAGDPADAPLAEYSVKPSTRADEDLIFTPEGFDAPGAAAHARGPEAGVLRLVVNDGDSGRPTPCRVNVVGPDGDYYEPDENRLKPYSLTGVWPKTGLGNRPEKAPIRYFGRFFYSTGESVVAVPAGTVRVEVWKGLEYRPETRTVTIGKAETRAVEIRLEHAAAMPGLGYYSGDPHVHFARTSDEDDRKVFDLLEAEGIHYGTPLAYNEPAGPYTGAMDRLAMPQERGLGARSARSRGGYHIVSGQEYRNATYGHMNLFLLDDLVLKGQSIDANNWPLYGDLARQARERGGVAFHAHGGYAQEVYADVVQDRIDAIELLQFGVYRGVGLIDWYRMLNCGFRIPIVGACDYPACRKLGDCVTYVQSAQAPDAAGWLHGAAAGRSFVTTGPLLLLEVNGQSPGARIARAGAGPHRVMARVRVRSEVAPVTNVQLIVNGRVVEDRAVAADAARGHWLEMDRPIELDRSGWVAARAFSLSRLGTPDAESHTNPVFITIDGKAPYDRGSLDVLVARLDGQIAAHKARKFPEQARVLAYFERSRDILLKIRDAGGAPASGHPSDIARDAALLDDAGRRTHTDAELRAFLKPVPPRPLDEALRTFETVDGFRMELVAHEPLVTSPVAGAFDEDGRLYVAEMRDYPYKPREGHDPLGSIRLLIDNDGDGRFDEGHVFADRLLWAAGIAPWKGGVFVAAPPDVWYLKDTDGDHRADVRERVFTGFGTQNQQAMLNNLQWGLDHKVYGATAGNGGTIRPAGRPDASPVSVDGRDFRFDPTTRDFEAITGTVQFGNTFDDWGERFLCSESQPLLHAVLPQLYLQRNPHLAVASAIHNLAPGPVPIFRISPIERWRQIRSSRRIAHGSRSPTAAGASHHVIDAAAGVTIYRGGAYPAQYYGSVFVGDAQNNLVHRRTLEPDGVTFRSRRSDEGTEFVRSSDIWFRPVNFVNAPDGTLYVLDMHREVLESIHIPSDVVKYLDLTSGRDRGRIYRLAPPGFRPPAPPRLSRSSTVALVEALESPHGWWRDTAHRLLYERQDQAAIAPLRRLLADSSLPQARLLALWSLQGLNALTDDDVLRALGDASVPVRCHALRLSEPRHNASPTLRERVLGLDRTDPRVRFQLAFTLGETNDSRAVPVLADIARSAGGDAWTRAAVLSSVSRVSADLLVLLLDDRAAGDLLESLATVVGARRREDELGRVFAALAHLPAGSANDALRTRIVRAAGDAMKASGGRLDAAVRAPREAAGLVGTLGDEARRRATDSSAAVPTRQEAIRLLSCLTFARSGPVLETLLDVRQPEPVQIEALRALAGYPNAEVAAFVLARWSESAPAVRAEAVESLLSRSDRALAFLDAVADRRADSAALDPAQRARLLDHTDSAVRSRARTILGASAASRQQVVDDYRQALRLTGAGARGVAVFRRECAACHRIGSDGNAVGPDLTSTAARDAEALLVHILDPNRYVLPNYTQYQVVDREGRIYSGLMAAQSATSITLRREQGKTDTILRGDIEQMVGSGCSLMPEGFEAKISKPEMADLLAFLRSSQGEAAPAGAPLEIGTVPGLIEPDR